VAAPKKKPAEKPAPKPPKKIRKRTQTKGPNKRLSDKPIKVQSEGFARNMMELSAALQVSTKAISYAGQKFPDLCPGKTELGYEIEKWGVFLFEVQKQNDDAMRDAKLHKTELESYRTEQQAELFRIKKEIEEGKIAYRDDVIETVCNEMIHGFVGSLRQMKWEIANAGYGLPREELAELVEKRVGLALQELVKGNWAQKKTFFRPLYARLCVLLPSLSFGDGPKNTSGESRTARKNATTRAARPSSDPSSTPSATPASSKSSASARRKAAKPS
jgi:hypothetical protein